MLAWYFKVFWVTNMGTSFVLYSAAQHQDGGLVPQLQGLSSSAPPLVSMPAVGDLLSGLFSGEHFCWCEWLACFGIVCGFACMLLFTLMSRGIRAGWKTKK